MNANDKRKLRKLVEPQREWVRRQGLKPHQPIRPGTLPPDFPVRYVDKYHPA